MKPAARALRPGAWEAPGRPRGSRALLVLGLAGTAALLVLLATRPEEGPPPSEPDPAPLPLDMEDEERSPAPLGRVDAVPSAPVAPRAHPQAVWSGEELLVWSGTLAVGPDGDPAPDEDGSFQLADDGAAYNPSTGRWRRLPPAPIRGRVGAAALWAGDRFVVWGGFTASDQPLGDGAAYIPARDEWVRLPAAPLDARGQAVAAWTGDEVLVVGGTRVAGRGAPARAAAARDGAAYDLAAGRWRPLPPLPAPVWPLPGRFAGAWGDDALFVWGRDLALYRTGADEWERIRPPTTGLWSGVAVQAASVDDGVVVFGLVVRGAPSVYGLHYQPDSETFETVPALARSVMTSRQRGAAAAGGRVVVLLGPPANRALAWRPGEPEWTALPGELARRDGAALVWTGQALLVWGGADDQTLRADGVAWQP